MSITLAAGDLALTQSAVSRQVHALEEQLGVRLLVRGHRSISFTPEGERLFRSANGAVQQLQDVIGGLRSRGRLRPVTISSAVGFATLWLLPRLGRLQKLHPGIDVRVSANNHVADMENEGIDLAIRYTSTSRAPRGSSRLFGETLAPVASPSLGVRSLRSPAALGGITLLELDDPRTPWLHWQTWLESVGWAGAKTGHSLRFNQYDMVIQAALAGQGVALGRVDLIQPLIEEKRLVYLAPPSDVASTTHAYWLVGAHEGQRREVHDVAAWITAEAATAIERARSDGARQTSAQRT